jgi:1-deoxy-D-xylulose-5-phosphate reductoisomerase
VPARTAPLSWTESRSLTFEPVDVTRFPCLRLARQAGAAGGTFPAALCGADEAAVSLFLQGRIPFTGIAGLVEYALNAHRAADGGSLEAIRNSERQAYSLVMAHSAESDMEGAAQSRARL